MYRNYYYTYNTEHAYIVYIYYSLHISQQCDDGDLHRITNFNHQSHKCTYYTSKTFNAPT